MQLLESGMMRVKVNDEAGSSPALLDSRQVRLEWPVSMRIGDQDRILLEFIPVDGESSSNMQQTGFSDAYADYTIMAEAKFEVAGVRVEAANPTRESMPPGQPVRFSWEINVAQRGSYTGNVWLSLRFLPIDGSPPIQEPVYVSEIGIRTSSLFGLSGTMARLLGGVGGFLSLLLVCNDMIGLISKRRKISELTTDERR